MNLFSTVICEYCLPLPEEVGELESPPTWNKVQFETKSIINNDENFRGFIDSYTIEDDGQIYKDVLERTFEIDEEGRSLVNEKNDGIEKVDFTGDLVFYTLHQEKEYDYWVEFSALFWKGDLKEIKLNEWKREDNSQRLESHEKMMAAVESHKKLRESKFFKIKELMKKPLRLIFYVIKFLLGLIVRVIWWLERKLV